MQARHPAATDYRDDSTPSSCRLTSLALDANAFADAALGTVGRLSSLAALSLYNCQLRSIPPWLSRLTALTALYLSDNHDLTVYSDDIRSVLACLTRLQNLALGEASTELVYAGEWVKLARACPRLTITRW